MPTAKSQVNGTTGLTSNSISATEIAPKTVKPKRAAAKPKKTRANAAKKPTKDKPKKPKGLVVKKPAKGVTKPLKQTYSKKDGISDRKAASDLGLGLIHFRVLRGLQLAKEGKAAACCTEQIDGNKGWMSYRDIERLTGYYSILAEVMHKNEEYSLVALGLATSGGFANTSSREKLHFRITAKGSKLLVRTGK